MIDAPAPPDCPPVESGSATLEACVDPELVARGWEPRFVSDQRRAKEAEELYAELGFEVRAEPAGEGPLGDACRECFAAATCNPQVLVYTRRSRRQ